VKKGSKTDRGGNTTSTEVPLQQHMKPRTRNEAHGWPREKTSELTGYDTFMPRRRGSQKGKKVQQKKKKIGVSAEGKKRRMQENFINSQSRVEQMDRPRDRGQKNEKQRKKEKKEKRTVAVEGP